jgi:hypothetical protein
LELGVLIVSFALSVSANSAASTSAIMPEDVTSVNVTVNGRKAFSELGTECSGYFYRLGVVIRLDACHPRWVVNATNVRAKGARIRVIARKET